MVETVLLGAALYVVLFLYLFLLPFIPGAMHALTNNPNRHRPKNEDDANKLEYPVSNFGFFTDMQQGRVKVVVSMGGQFVRALMDYAGHLFVGERPEPSNKLRPREPAYWQVVEKRKTHEDRDSHPIPYPHLTWFTWYRLLYYPHSILWWAWKRYIYKLTGKAFFGFPPFRKIHVRAMRRTLIIRVHNPQPGERPFRLVEKNDFTDHSRATMFQFTVFLPNVNCQDTIPVMVVVNYIGRVDNPWRVVYETEDWPTRLYGSVSDAVTAFGRTHPVSQVLTTKGQGADKGAGELSRLIARIGQTADGFAGNPPFSTYTFDGSASAVGIQTAKDSLPQIVDVSPINKTDLEQLAAPAFAEAQKRARRSLAKGEAAFTTEIGKALKNHPDALRIALAEAQKETARAAGDKAIINMDLSGKPDKPDPTLASILKILKDNAGSDS